MFCCSSCTYCKSHVMHVWFVFLSATRQDHCAGAREHIPLHLATHAEGPRLLRFCSFSRDLQSVVVGCSLEAVFQSAVVPHAFVLGCSFVRLHLALCVTSHPSRCFYPHPRLNLRVPLISPIVVITVSSPHKQQAINGVLLSILTRLSHLLHG